MKKTRLWHVGMVPRATPDKHRPGEPRLVFHVQVRDTPFPDRAAVKRPLRIRAITAKAAGRRYVRGCTELSLLNYDDGGNTAEDLKNKRYMRVLRRLYLGSPQRRGAVIEIVKAATTARRDRLLSRHTHRKTRRR